MSEKKKLILAYSGGLDTSVILKWLINKEFDVICFVGNVGQKDDFNEVEKKALETGASKVHIVDLREEFVTDFIFPALRGNAIYEGRYLLGTALARPLLARKYPRLAPRHAEQIWSPGLFVALFWSRKRTGGLNLSRLS